MTAMVEMTMNPTRYGELLAQTLPVAIQNDVEYERMLAELEKLMDKALRQGDEALSPEETQLFRLMTLLVEVYEQQKYPIPKAEVHEIIQFLMRDRQLRQRDLLPVLGSRGVTSEIINGKRSPSKTQARALGEFFGVSPDLFVPRLESSGIERT